MRQFRPGGAGPERIERTPPRSISPMTCMWRHPAVEALHVKPYTPILSPQDCSEVVLCFNRCFEDTSHGRERKSFESDFTLTRSPNGLLIDRLLTVP